MKEKKEIKQSISNQSTQQLTQQLTQSIQLNQLSQQSTQPTQDQVFKQLLSSVKLVNTRNEQRLKNLLGKEIYFIDKKYIDALLDVIYMPIEFTRTVHSTASEKFKKEIIKLSESQNVSPLEIYLEIYRKKLIKTVNSYNDSLTTNNLTTNNLTTDTTNTNSTIEPFNVPESLLTPKLTIPEDLLTKEDESIIDRHIEKFLYTSSTVYLSKILNDYNKFGNTEEKINSTTLDCYKMNLTNLLNKTDTDEEYNLLSDIEKDNHNLHSDNNSEDYTIFPKLYSSYNKNITTDIDFLLLAKDDRYKISDYSPCIIISKNSEEMEMYPINLSKKYVNQELNFLYRYTDVIPKHYLDLIKRAINILTTVSDSEQEIKDNLDELINIYKECFEVLNIFSTLIDIKKLTQSQSVRSKVKYTNIPYTTIDCNISNPVSYYNTAYYNSTITGTGNITPAIIYASTNQMYSF